MDGEEKKEGRGMDYPGHPSTTILPKNNLPCWLQGLKILVRLEESAQRQCVHDAEGKEKQKHRLSGRTTAMVVGVSSRARFRGFRLMDGGKRCGRWRHSKQQAGRQAGQQASSRKELSKQRSAKGILVQCTAVRERMGSGYVRPRMQRGWAGLGRGGG